MKEKDFNHVFIKLSRQMERLILLLIICFATILVTGEMLYAWEPVRRFLVETARLEGISE